MKPLQVVYVVCLLTLLPLLIASENNNIMAEKSKWPELVGKTGEEAKGAILAERPNLEIQIIPDDAMMTMDFRTDRVRILVNSEGKVSKEPRVG